MTKRSSDGFDRALDAASSSEMRACLGAQRGALTLPQIAQLTRRLQASPEPTLPFRLGVVHTYTSEALDPYLEFEARLQGLVPAVYHAPYGVTIQEAQAGSGLSRHAPDLTLVLLRWEDLDPVLAGPTHALGETERRDLSSRAIDTISSLAAAFRGVVGGHIAVTLLPSMTGPGLGLYDASAAHSDTAWRAGVKAQMAARLSELASVTLLDLDEIMAEIGRGRFFDRRWWYTSRFPFTSEAAQEVARRTMAVGAVLKSPRAKVIALDADNTLWGGIIGEDGPTGIALGPDYPGNVYVSFQRRLLEYQQRGFLLVLCSKNNPEDALEVIRNHPHMVLREQHFAAMRIDWNPKAGNLQSMADELNLGIDSFVMVDDSDHECLTIRQSLPMVEVVQVPTRAVEIPTCLDAVARLEVLQITAEDRRRTEMYVQQRQRREMAGGAGDVAGYLRSLDMRMTIGLDDVSQVPRVAQLTQKTNQFNLTTRRYTESDIRGFMTSPDWLVAQFSLTDIFGDSGLVGVLLVHLAGETAEIDTLLMSCRVIGRKAESAFVERVLALVAERGVRTVLADHLPTAKNKLVEGFLPEHGFTRREDGRWTRNLADPAPAVAADLPIAVQIVRAEHEVSAS